MTTKTNRQWKVNDNGRADFLEWARLKGKEVSEMEGYPRSNDGGWYISDENGRVALVDFKGKAKRGEAYKTVDAEGFSNARLIAASPTMLHQIEVAIDLLSGALGKPDAEDRIDAALAALVFAQKEATK